jgi:hypothetical protein
MRGPPKGPGGGPLQVEIRRREVDQPGQLDLEIRRGVAVDVAFDHGDVGADLIVDLEEAQPTPAAGECGRADEDEVRVAIERAIGVDGREVDLVLPLDEIRDGIARVGISASFGDGIPVEIVVADAAGLDVAAEEEIVSVPPLSAIVSASLSSV